MTDTTRMCRFLYELGHLKRTPRTGWLVGGAPGRIESVAEHSFRTAILAHVVAAAEGASPDRAATLGLYHDMPETRIGDIPYVGRGYLTAVDAETVATHQTAGMPLAVAEPIRQAIAEFEARRTTEAVCAKDADKLECLLQAREYQAAGAADIDGWIETSTAGLVTATARALAADAVRMRPGAWWREAVGVADDGHDDA